MSQPPPPPHYGAPMYGHSQQQQQQAQQQSQQHQHQQQHPPPPRPPGHIPGYPQQPQQGYQPQQMPAGPGAYGPPRPPSGPPAPYGSAPPHHPQQQQAPAPPRMMMQAPRGGPPTSPMPPPPPGGSFSGGMGMKVPSPVPPPFHGGQPQHQAPLGPPKAPGAPPTAMYGQAQQQQQQQQHHPSPPQPPRGMAMAPPPPMRPPSAIQGMGASGPPRALPPPSHPGAHAPQPPPPRPAAPLHQVPIGGAPPPPGPPPPPMMGRPSPSPMMQQQQQPPPPPGGPPGVQQLAGQFSQMGLRPPPQQLQQQQQPPPPPMMKPPSASPYPQQDTLGSPAGVGTGGGFPGHYRTPSLDTSVGGAPPGMGVPSMSSGSSMPGMENANQLPMLSEVDLSIVSNPRFMRFTVSKIPNSQNNAAATKLPLGVVIQPMALDAAGEDSIDVVNFGATGIVRCKKCRTYINPFVSWHDAGRRWRCNVCGTLNDVPSSYFHHVDQAGQRRDKHERPELSNGSVELVAPGEYMVRPPQPPVYVFVLDVSYGAVASGALGCAVETIKRHLDALPGDPRTQFGLVTFDSTVHFYHFKPTLKMPQVLVIPDISELFLPLPEDLLVNLKESREVIDSLLEALPGMYDKTRSMDSALGPALTGAYRVMAPVGGKMCVVSATMPTLGDGRLKHREELRALGTEREHSMLNPEESWYRTKAVEFSRVQISVDLFVAAPAGQQSPYTDLASLAALPKFTGGNLFYYPGFSVEKGDGRKMGEEMGALLTRPTGFEAVMRVRATRGLKVTQFYGNYYIRGTDLLALPNCSSESVFGVEMAHDEAFLTASVICVQAALLHTSSTGERRIRVHTVAAPVTAVLQEVIASVDVDTLCNLMAKRSLEVVLKTGLDAARHRLTQQCADILRSCRAFCMPHQPQGPGGYHQQQQQQQPAGLPPSLELLPLYTMALTKNVTFRGGNDIRPDMRVYMMHLLSVMNVATSRVFTYPNLFALHTLEPDVGVPLPLSPVPAMDGSSPPPPPPPAAGKKQVKLPVAINLSAERFVSEGLYLLENGVSLYLWVGARADPQLLASLFGGMTSVDGVEGGVLAQAFEDQLGKEGGDEYAKRVHALVQGLREERGLRWMALQVVKEGEGGPEAVSFYWNLVEDRAAFSGGQYNYGEFMGMMGRGAGVGGGVGGPPVGMGGPMGGAPMGGPPPGMGYGPPPGGMM